MKIKHLLLLLLLTSCAHVPLKGATVVDLPGDNDFQIHIKASSMPELVKDVRDGIDEKKYGFRLSETYSREDFLKKYNQSSATPFSTRNTQPGDWIWVLADDHFYFDAPTVPTYGIQTYKDHYQASQLYSYQLWNAYQECLAKVPTEPEPTPPGSSNCRVCSDGAGGCLFKPVSDSTGTPVILMPGTSAYANTGLSFSDPTLHVLRTHCCDTNGNRQHWYLSKKSSSITQPLEVYFENGSCMLVPDTSKRYD